MPAHAERSPQRSARRGVLLLTLVLSAFSPDTTAPAGPAASGNEPMLDVAEITRRFPQPMRLRQPPTALTDVPSLQQQLRGWLDAGDFVTLESRLMQLRSEADQRRSDRLFDAVFAVFADADVALEASLDAWVTSRRDSAYAHAARGSHWLARGHQARGGRWASKTSPERFAAMWTALDRARADLEHARILDPQLAQTEAALLELRMHGQRSDSADSADEADDAAAAAERRRQRNEAVLAAAARFPHSYAVQYAAMMALQPRWGGDVDTLVRIAAEAPVRASHPDFVLLRSLSACLIAQEMRIRDWERLALSMHEEIARRYGDGVHPYCERSRALADLGQGHAEAAEHALRRYLALMPHDERGYRDLWRSLRRQSRPAEALAALDTALALRPSSTAAACERAWFHDYPAAPDLALDRIERALAQNPLDDGCWLRRGHVLAALGRRDEADRAIARAAQLASDDSLVQREQGIHLIEAERYEEAVAALDAVLAADRGDSVAWYWRGVALRQLERTREALASFDEAIALSPRHTAAWYERGLVRAYFARDLAAAEADLHRATDLSPAFAEAWFELAGVRYRQRDCGFVPALRHFVAHCEQRRCAPDRLAWARGKLDDPGLARLCPGA